MLKIMFTAAIMAIAITGISIALSPFEEAETQNFEYLNKYSESLADKKTPVFPPLHVMYGTSISSIDSLKTESSFDVKESNSLPRDVEVKRVFTNNDEEGNSKLSTVIYAPASISFENVKTSVDVLDSYGILVLYSDGKSDKWYNDYLEQVPGVEALTINGMKAIGYDADPSKGEKSELTILSNNQHIQLVSVGYGLDQLIEIAKTL